MEELTKNQLILLALLVSFVTSIATGIATVSLLEQAPPKVTRVINRVVERTVERVTPTEGENVVTKEETIIIKEEDVITESIASASLSLVRIYTGIGDRAFVGLGFVASSDGLIVTSSDIIVDDTPYSIRLSDGKEVSALSVFQGDKSIALLRATAGENTQFNPSSIGDSRSVKLGQSVIAISGRDNVTVATGIISKIDSTKEDPDETPLVTSIHSTVSSEIVLPGTMLINIFGEVVGMSTSAGSSEFLPIHFVEESIETL